MIGGADAVRGISECVGRARESFDLTVTQILDGSVGKDRFLDGVCGELEVARAEKEFRFETVIGENRTELALKNSPLARLVEEVSWSFGIRIRGRNLADLLHVENAWNEFFELKIERVIGFVRVVGAERFGRFGEEICERDVFAFPGEHMRAEWNQAGPLLNTEVRRVEGLIHRNDFR